MTNIPLEGAGKGPTARKVDQKKWDDCPLWANREKRLKAEAAKKKREAKK